MIYYYFNIFGYCFSVFGQVFFLKRNLIFKKKGAIFIYPGYGIKNLIRKEFLYNAT